MPIMSGGIAYYIWATLTDEFGQCTLKRHNLSKIKYQGLFGISSSGNSERNMVYTRKIIKKIIEKQERRAKFKLFKHLLKFESFGCTDLYQT